MKRKGGEDAMEGTTESEEGSEPRQTHCRSSLRSHTGAKRACSVILCEGT